MRAGLEASTVTPGNTGDQARRLMSRRLGNECGRDYCVGLYACQYTKSLMQVYKIRSLQSEIDLTSSVIVITVRLKPDTTYGNTVRLKADTTYGNTVRLKADTTYATNSLRTQRRSLSRVPDEDCQDELLLGLIEAEVVIQEGVEHAAERPRAHAQCRRCEHEVL